MRIIHLPSPTGGQAWGLSQAEKKLGHQTFNLIFKDFQYGYKHDKDLNLGRYNIIVRYFIQLYYLFYLLPKFDVFHFYFGRTFIPFHLDLIILKIFRKKIFFTFQGSDIRQKKLKYSFQGKVYNLNFDYIPKKKSDLIKKIKIKFTNLLADGTFSLNPDLLLVSPKSKFIYYSHMNINQISPTYLNKNKNTKFTIIHAPSKRDVKGTKYIIQAVNNLKKKFPFIELDLVENEKTTEVFERAKKADLAIDQLILGWYGGYAVEMMSLGIPVICYINRDILSYLNFNQDLPFINANPKNIKDKIEYLITHREKLNEISKKSRFYVEKYHDPNKIAQFTNQEYNNAFK